jgi:hypothetical protein
MSISELLASEFILICVHQGRKKWKDEKDELNAELRSMKEELSVAKHDCLKAIREHKVENDEDCRQTYFMNSENVEF